MYGIWKGVLSLYAKEYVYMIKKLFSVPQVIESDMRNN